MLTRKISCLWKPKTTILEWIFLQQGMCGDCNKLANSRPILRCSIIGGMRGSRNWCNRVEKCNVWITLILLRNFSLYKDISRWCWVRIIYATYQVVACSMSGFIYIGFSNHHILWVFQTLLMSLFFENCFFFLLLFSNTFSSSLKRHILQRH